MEVRSAVVAERLRTVMLTDETLVAAENCLTACANDEREPERYRITYAKAAMEINEARRTLDD